MVEIPDSLVRQLEAALVPFSNAYERLCIYGGFSNDTPLVLLQGDTLTELHSRATELGDSEDELLCVGHLADVEQLLRFLTGK